MASDIARRKFLATLGGAAAAWPLAARAQQPAMPVIGHLESGGPGNPTYHTAFRKGLNELGYVEGRSVAIEYRTAEHYDRLPALAAELVRRPVTVMYTTGDVASLVAKTATAMTPIVFAMGEDPIQAGLVVSLNRPGGNITGVSFFSGTLAAKWLEYLRELIPQTTTIAFLVNPANVRTEIDKREMRAAVRSAALHYETTR